MERIRVVVSGHVQGVFFRDSCRQEAGRLGVSGWVRNDPGGTVSAELEGEAAALDALVAWCRRGPRFAEVTGVETQQVPATGTPGFEVR